jgi:hypothetical protein
MSAGSTGFDAAFFGSTERAALVRDEAVPILHQWHILGLRQHVVTPFFSMSFVGVKLVFCIRTVGRAWA